MAVIIGAATSCSSFPKLSKNVKQQSANIKIRALGGLVMFTILCPFLVGLVGQVVGQVAILLQQYYCLVSWGRSRPRRK